MFIILYLSWGWGELILKHKTAIKNYCCFELPTYFENLYQMKNTQIPKSDAAEPHLSRKQPATPALPPHSVSRDTNRPRGFSPSHYPTRRLCRPDRGLRTHRGIPGPAEELLVSESGCSQDSGVVLPRSGCCVQA